MTAQDDTLTILLAGSPPRLFSNVGVLLKPDLWFAWLEKHPGHAKLLAVGHGCLVKLGAHTDWDEDRVLDRLGCDAKSEDRFLDLTDDQMRLCTEYFEWVESLLCNLDLASDKRLAVSGAARFFAAADKDLDRCKATMEAGQFPPLEYLKLGEIAQSWQCAIRSLDGPRGERARRTQRDNPFIDDTNPHLSPKRLDMLALPNPQRLFGPNVEERVRDHLKRCGVCAEAYACRGTGVNDRRRGLVGAGV
jgi:hypothetical protein